MSLTPNEKDLLAKKSDLEGILKPDANDILHLPDITISLAENQQGYTTSGLSKDGLVFAGAGTITGITSSDGNSTSLAASQSAVSAKQDKLIAGSNITIAQDGKTISATDTNEIEDLQDVDITNLANGQILKYNSTSQKWENGNESGGGSSTLAGLSDVDITSPSAGQGLVYDATNQEWVNGNVSTSSSIDTLTDVNLTNLSNGQILKYNSTSQEWENANESGGGGSSALSDLTDVTVTSPSDGQVLTYDNTSGKWVNDTPTASSSISTLTDVNLTSLTDGQILKYDATNDEWVNADESGGGGGSYTEEVLWSGNESTSRWVEPIVLNIDITDYDMLSIRCGVTNEAGGVHIILTSEIPSGSSSGDGTVSLGTFTDSQYSIWLNKDDNILRIFTSTGVSINVKEVVGIKYGSSSSGGIEELWTGLVYPESQPETVTLSKPYDDYDYIIITSYALYSNVNFYTTDVFYDLKLNERNMGALNAEVYNCVLCIPLSSTSLQFPYYGNLGRNTHITGVYGAKLGGGSGAGAEELTLAEYNALTTEQKNDGMIRFIPENPYGIITDIDMSTITNLSEYKITITPSSDEIELDFDHNVSSGIGGTFYLTTAIDVTNYDYIKYDLTTGVCYNSIHQDTNPLRNLGIGLCRTAPSSWQYPTNVAWAVSNIYDVNDINSTFSDEVIDVSNLTGNYYFVVSWVAWEATISNLSLATEGGNPSQIKYMNKTYGSREGSSINYSTTERIVGTWIDGSTIYQKSYETTLPYTYDTTNSFIIDNDVSYIDAIIGYEGSCKNTSGYIASTGMPDTTGWCFGLHRNPSNQLVLYGNMTALYGGKAYVTIKYTKVSN